MSRIMVKAGDTVAKEQQIGVSGSTGMAFGDHVHFSMMVAGVQIDPKEWWDEHWIHDRILSKLGAGQLSETASASSPEPAKKHKRTHKR
jgi:murein DD-endopeptidase MepM/ murein hydrolase activator NlpD